MSYIWRGKRVNQSNSMIDAGPWAPLALLTRPFPLAHIYINPWPCIPCRDETLGSLSPGYGAGHTGRHVTNDGGVAHDQA